MRVSDLLEPTDYKFYTQVPQPPGGWPERESPKALRKSLDKAHDNVQHLLRENDRLRLALIKLHERQRWLLKVFIALMGATWTALAALLQWLVPYAIHGMTK